MNEVGMLNISPDLSIPYEAVTQTFGVLAKRGVGKTYTVLVMVEEMLAAHLPVVVVDPIGVCWGLRSSADGEGPGLPIVVMGGDHGDVPLEVTSGEIIADFVIDSGQSAVLDLSLFRKGEQVRFMTDFAERLYHKNRQPLHLVLDEADAFAPQRPMKGQERMLGAIEDLVRRGRARGIGVSLVTQRAAVLNKDVLTQVEVLVALRTIAPQDRDAIDAWIRVHGTQEERDTLMQSLPSLPIGTAWFWSPGWLDLFQKVKVRARRTFDSSATPKVGSVAIVPKRLAEVDLDALRERIAATIERVKADDPVELRRRIVQLEKALREQPSGAPVVVEKVVVERVEVPVIPIGLVERLRDLDLAVNRVQNELGAIRRDIQAAADGQAIEVDTGRLVPLLPFQLQKSPKTADSARPIAETDNNGGRIHLKAGARKMLAVMAQHYPMRVTRKQLGTLSRYTASGGTFISYFSTLKRAGLILEGGDGQVEITQNGFDYLGESVPGEPQTHAELLATWRAVLKLGERKMLDKLVEVYPRSLTKEELGEAAGYTASGGTFGSYLGNLRRNGLIESTTIGIRASDTLFMDR